MSEGGTDGQSPQDHLPSSADLKKELLRSAEELGEELDPNDIAKAMDVLDMIQRVKRFEDGDSGEHSQQDEGTHPPADTKPSVSYDGVTDLPKQIGRFEIREQLGEGGHGIVLRAFDPKLKREVALKIPRPEVLITQELRVRFLREAEAAAAVNHANIVPVFESGADGPLCFIAYAYCEGESLAEWISRHDQQMSPRDAARLIGTLAEALQHAHSRGVVHRDLKPGNILLQAETDSDVALDASARITDFGLAKIQGADQGVTRSGSILGTPNYLSPEQAEGGKEEVGPASDIYALGIILYELLAGKTPFARESSLATLKATRVEEPAPIRRFNPHVPRDLESICMRCLEKQPANRYASASDLSADIQRFLEGLPVRARPVGTLARAQRWCRRNKFVTSAALITFVGLTTGLIIAFLEWQRAEGHLAESQRQRNQAQQNLDRANREWRRAEQLLDESRQQRKRAQRNFGAAQDAIDQLLTEVAENLRNVPQMQPLQRGLLVKAMELNQQFLDDDADDPELQFEAAAAFRRSANIKLMLGEFDECQKAATRAIELCEAARDGLEETDMVLIEMARSYSLRGEQFRSRSLLSKAEEDLDTANNLVQDYVKLHPDDAEHVIMLARNLRDLGVIAEKSGNVAASKQRFEEALARLDAVKPNDRQSELYLYSRSNVLNSLAIQNKARGKYDEASTHYAEAIELLEDLVAKFPMKQSYQRSFAATTYNLGNVCYAKKDFDTALEHYDEATEIYKTLVRDFSYSPAYRRVLAQIYVAIGLSHKRLNHADEAESAYLQALAINQELVRRYPDVPFYQGQVNTCLNNLSTIYLNTDRLDDAQRVLEESLDSRQKLHEQFPRIITYREGLAMTLVNLGTVKSFQGLHAEGAECFRKAIDHQQVVYESNPENPKYQKYLADDMEYLARALVSLGKIAEAADRVDEIGKISTTQWGPAFKAGYVHCKLLQQLKSDEQIDEDQRDQWAKEFKDRAIVQLQKSEQLGLADAKLIDISVFDPLRDDDRFNQLLQAIAAKQQ